MKRFLSLILTLALVLSFVPAVFAESEVPEEQMFDFKGKVVKLIEVATDDVVPEGYSEKWEFDGIKYYINSEYSAFAENRNWRIMDINEDIVKLVPVAGKFGLHTSNGLVASCSSSNLNKAFKFAVSMKPQATGFYVPFLEAYCGSGAFKLKWYLDEYETGKETLDNYGKNLLSELTSIAKTGTLFCGVAVTDADSKNRAAVDQVIYAEKDKELVSVIDGSNRNFRFYNMHLEPVVDAKIAIKVNDSAENFELDTEANTTASITSTLINGTVNTEKLVEEVSPDDASKTVLNIYSVNNVAVSLPVKGDFADSVVYKSSDENVAKVDDSGAITAVGGGTAKIYAQTPDGLVKSNEITVTVTAPAAPEEDEALTDAFKVEEEVAKDYVAPTVAGLTSDGAIAPVDNKDGTFTLTAPETKGDAKFLYWAKGMTANKRIISFSNVIENYVPEEVGKNYLIAVYDDNAVETAEYYNANGQLIARGVAPEYPSMAGYGKAKAWKQYGETNIFVAEYELEAVAKNIDVTVVNGSGTGTYAYGDTVECIASGEGTFKCWTKTGINGKTEIVSMDSSYKFKAWEKCTVAAVYGDYTYTGAKCKIIIDSFTAGDENVIMAEFIGFGTDVLEKGIMWNGNKIAMAKPGNQFTVIADKNGEYKGYAILGNATDGYTLITDDSLTVSDAK